MLTATAKRLNVKMFFKCKNDYSVQNGKSLRRHCTNERRVRKRHKKVRRDEIMTTTEDGEREGSSDVRWKTVPQTSGCDKKRSVTDGGQTSTLNVRKRCALRPEWVIRQNRSCTELFRWHTLLSISQRQHWSSRQRCGWAIKVGYRFHSCLLWRRPGFVRRCMINPLVVTWIFAAWHHYRVRLKKWPNTKNVITQ